MSPLPDRNRVRLEGIGLHSGHPVAAILSPGQDGTGITINGTPALLANVTSTNRATTIGGVALVEHLLSAAYGLGRYDLEVTVEGGELPALDGSALPWVEALEKLKIQKSKVKTIELQKPIKVEENGASIEAYPADGFSVDFMVEFEGLGLQKFVFNAQNMSYKAEIAPARTFGYLEEHEALKGQGLGLGASADNALVLTKQGYAGTPRFPDEPVRHTILDLVGDLALLGRPLKARIIADRSGHKLNAELTRRILAQWK
jgi:UDP-3-O-[3-hydroxymyristoyl] N-acetylglucosamine deacetylase